jgi:hypothetical protein
MTLNSLRAFGIEPDLQKLVLIGADEAADGSAGTQ